uniref:Src homology 2 domain containing transforming protein D n=1 Tax=Monodelphis domestica TaxID=13616 RepID=F7D345_MONDO
MAKWLRDYLSFGGRRPPPQPPKPDYTESDIFRAYRVQKSLDFEDPYEDGDGQEEPESTCPSCPNKPSCPGDPSYSSPKHRLIKVESGDLNRSKMLLGAPGEDKTADDSEYSDPFDAQPDAQLDLQLYDTPYEEQEVGGSPEAEERPRQSRLPRDDERPAEEYDQPWEWKKDHISRAFAVQFETPEWERAPGLAKEFRRPPEHIPQPAERVDPALPLEKQPSSQGYMHMKFTRTKENKFVLGQHSGVFSSVPEVVHHYSIRPLPVQGTEHLALLHPITAQVP